MESGQNEETLVTGHFFPGPEGFESGILSFKGHWRASNGADGRFVNFDLVMDSVDLVETGNADSSDHGKAVPSIFHVSNEQPIEVQSYYPMTVTAPGPHSEPSAPYSKWRSQIVHCLPFSGSSSRDRLIRGPDRGGRTQLSSVRPQIFTSGFRVLLLLLY